MPYLKRFYFDPSNAVLPSVITLGNSFCYWCTKTQGRLFVVFVCLIFLLPHLQGQHNQQTNVKFIGVNDGLSHREVFAINHDQQGFIWLATRTGLDRYDGTDFLHFKYPDAYSKISNKVTNYKDHNDILWLIGLGKQGNATQNKAESQALFFDLQNQVFLEWADYFGKSAPFALGLLDELSIVNKQTPLFSLSDGRRFLFENDSFFQLPADIGPKDLLGVFQSRVYFFQETEDRFTLQSWSKETGEKKIIHKIAAQARINYRIVRQDSIAYLMEKTERGYNLYTIGPYGKIGEKSEVSAEPATSIFPANTQANFLLAQKQQLWSIYQGQVYCIDLKEKKLIAFNQKPLLDTGTALLDVHFGALGNLWVGTKNGIFLYQFLKSPFRKYLYQESEVNLQDRISLRGLMVQEQHLIANSYQGQFELDLSTPGALPTVRSPGIFYPIMEGNAGEQLYAWKSLYRKIPGIEQAEVIEADSLLGKIEIWSLQKDVKQQIWFGLEKGLAILVPQDSLIRRFTQFNNYPEIQTATVNHFLKIDRKQYLLATSKGIFQLDIDQGIIAHFYDGAEGKAQLPFNQFNHIHRSEDGVFWLASAGAGLIRWNMESGIYQQYNLENGLSNEVLYFIYEDKRGFLWIGSDYGLIRFNKRYEELMVYLEKDGISHHEFNRIAHFQAQDGVLYFGTINGVTAFNPLQVLPKRQSDFPLLWTQLTQLKDGERQQFNTFPEGFPELIVRPKDRLYRLDFRLLDYWGAERCKYAYKIDGFQEEWFELEEGGIMIPGLPYGNYTLQIRGQDANGRLSEKTLTLPIQVLRPWWQKRWFWFLFLVSVISTIIIFSIFRIRQAERSRRILEGLVKERTEELEKDKKTIEVQSQELQQMSYLKSKFFVNIAHELRTPLTLLKGPISSVLKSNELGNRNFTMLAMAQNNLQKILQLIEEILDLGKLEEGKLKVEPRPILLKDLLNQLELNFSTLAQETQVSLSQDNQCAPNLVLFTDEAKLDKVLANLLSNAIRFTPAQGKVVLKTQASNGQVIFQVSDSGPGIPEEDLPFIFERYYQSSANEKRQVVGGTGIGLAISREYGHLLGGELEVWNKPEGGACFQFVLPFTTTEADEESLAKAKPDFDPTIRSAASAVSDVSNQNGQSLIKGAILIVEDHADLSSYLQTVLNEDGWRTKVVPQGQAALDYLATCSPQTLPELIMTDMMMPILSGEDLVKALKADKKYESIPLLVLTAKTGREDQLNMLHLGVDDYLTKPFSLEELLARINNLYRNHHQRIQAFEKYKTDQVQFEKEWLKEVESIILKHKGNFDFSVNTLAEALNMSRRQLYRKMHLESGLTPNEFIQEVKFRLARNLLEHKSVDSVKALAFAIGVKDVANFSKNYKKRFGKLPSAYL